MVTENCQGDLSESRVIAGTPSKSSAKSRTRPPAEDLRAWRLLTMVGREVVHHFVSRAFSIVIRFTNYVSIRVMR